MTKISIRISFLFFLILSCIETCDAQDCGTKRWSIKTLSDKDTLAVNFKKIIPTTVHKQTLLIQPIKLKKHRMVSEDTVYSLTCNIIGFKKEEDDMDIHIIIQDLQTKETMVAEIPSAECLSVIKTSRYKQIKELDEWFSERIGIPKKKFTYPSKPILVTITGVGFFDSIHGQNGMAANGREIHPVLSMKLK